MQHNVVALCLQQNLQKIKSIQERLLSQEQRDSECFPVSIGVCAAFLSRRASRNGSEDLEEMLLDGVATEPAIVALFTRMTV